MERSSKDILSIGSILNNINCPLKDRFRALFTLRNLGGPVAVEQISKCFCDSSALLKHELAYCLGQMKDPAAIPILIQTLENKKEEPMVRHEAAEALGAIGFSSCIELLEQYSQDPVIEVAETCQLARQKIEWSQSEEAKKKEFSLSIFTSVDPTPPHQETDIQKLKEILVTESLPLFDRYRAMFSLRNLNSEDSAKALAAGFKCKSALFRHEIGYVLGQMSCHSVVEDLIKVVKDLNENEMVRHEAAEALGSIANDEGMEILKDFTKDKSRVVRESCYVALDMIEHEKSSEFQYANGLSMIDQSIKS